MREWWYNDFQHVGSNYADTEIAAQYDEKMNKLRDIPKEADEMVNLLQLDKNSTVIDFGCGTGLISVELAKHCKQVIGVDISPAMLDIARAKTSIDKIPNVEWVNGSILRFDYEAESVDAVIMGLALHHVPDFWKAVAFQRINEMLKPDGRIWIFDVIYSFDMNNFEDTIDQWIRDINEKTDGKTDDGKQFKNEFSTFNWIMEGLMERAGFIIENENIMDGFLARYIARKK